MFSYHKVTSGKYQGVCASYNSSMRQCKNGLLYAMGIYWPEYVWTVHVLINIISLPSMLRYSFSCSFYFKHIRVYVDICNNFISQMNNFQGITWLTMNLLCLKIDQEKGCELTQVTGVTPHSQTALHTALQCKYTQRCHERTRWRPVSVSLAHLFFYCKFYF